MRSEKYIIVDYNSNKEMLKSVHDLGIEGYEHLYNLSRKDWLRIYKVYIIRLYVNFDLNIIFDKYSLPKILKGDYNDIGELKSEYDLFNENKIKLSNSKKREQIKALKKQIEKIELSIE